MDVSNRMRGRRPAGWAAALAALAAGLAALPASPPPPAVPAVAVTAGHGQPVPADWVPPLDSVASLRLSLRAPAGPAEAPLPLYTTHPDHRPTIAVVLDLLLGSRLAPGAAVASPKGPVLQIALRRGEPVAVQPAGDCPGFSSESGHGFACPPSPSDVILRRGDGRQVRLFNPQMAAWLQEGWREHVPTGEPALLDREAAIALAREQSRLPGWQASFVDAYPVERPGEIEVRRAWLLEAELPAGQRIRLVLDALTGEVLRLVQLEAME